MSQRQINGYRVASDSSSDVYSVACLDERLAPSTREVMLNLHAKGNRVCLTSLSLIDQTRKTSATTISSRTHAFPFLFVITARWTHVEQSSSSTTAHTSRCTAIPSTFPTSGDYESGCTSAAAMMTIFPRHPPPIPYSVSRLFFIADDIDSCFRSAIQGRSHSVLLPSHVCTHGGSPPFRQ